MRILLALALIAGLSGLAHADALEEKLCLFTAAQRLPLIPGLTVSSARTSSISIPEAAVKLIGSYSNVRTAAESMDRTFGLIDGKLAEALRYPNINPPGPLLTEALIKALKGSTRASLDVKALGLEAIYGFVCGWDANGALAIAALGMSQ